MGLYGFVAPPYAPSLQPTQGVRNHSLTASSPTNVKMKALTTCGGSRAREYERTWERKTEERRERRLLRAWSKPAEALPESGGAPCQRLWSDERPF
ncbi:unnamed protein product [Pleuronectes platessa]|uniref:Uncharacterized protein n=1 Tax=Pleuronectes platessa TaxID=8262 RepID=A0A9N7U2V1_PLEPL|nr:unnamed protein product [Pleuronectes platessa]